MEVQVQYCMCVVEEGIARRHAAKGVVVHYGAQIGVARRRATARQAMDGRPVWHVADASFALVKDTCLTTDVLSPTS